jgi:hypothetical protein
MNKSAKRTSLLDEREIITYFNATLAWIIRAATRNDAIEFNYQTKLGWLADRLRHVRGAALDVGSHIRNLS